jgi:hypothetical protein
MAAHEIGPTGPACLNARALTIPTRPLVRPKFLDDPHA